MTNEKGKNKFAIIITRYIRIDDVIKWCAIAFIGFILGTSSFALPGIILPTGVFLVAIFFLMSFTFAINNYYDADSDRKNPRRMYHNAVASGEISKKEGMILNILFVAISLLSVIFFKPDLVLFLLLLLLFVWLAVYSAPPFRLKGYPGIDVIWHIGGFFLFTLFASLFAGSPTLLSWLVALSIGVFSGVGQLWNHYVDYEFDKEMGTQTFAARFGLETTKKAIYGILAVHLVIVLLLFFLYSSHYLITLLIVVGGLIVGFLLFKPTKGGFPTRKSLEFYLTIVVGGSIYVSCLFYHFFSVIKIDLIVLY
jgi:4-hydroxybenzoate polyprenyltransferase